MQETAVRFAICDDDKVYAEKMKALILQTFHLPQPVCVWRRDGSCGSSVV